jgi:GntR family transcriptional regulator
MRERWEQGRAIQEADTGPRPNTVDVEIGEVPAPPWVAEPLGVAPATMVVYRTRRFIVDDRYVQLAKSYLPTDVAGGTAIMHTDTGPGGMYPGWPRPATGQRLSQSI